MHGLSKAKGTLTVLAVAVILGAAVAATGAESIRPTGSVIFIHPDGSGGSMWNALRCYAYGPDSTSNWDRLERMGLYRSHLLNSTNASSHGGATVHSYGVKVPFDTYGSCDEKPVVARSGQPWSIMKEAQKAGFASALINSGHICEPGTGVFVAGAEDRDNTDLISEQIINSGVDIILSGGENLLLPSGMVGRHGAPGVRKDGRNLIKQAEELGYTVVFTRDELMALGPSVERVLGVFSPEHTFNDQTEEKLRDLGLPLYNPHAPTVAEMTEAALRILKNCGKRFLMVVEEEGTDNFANENNARGTLEALMHADRAIGVAVEYVRENPETLILTAADSDAGGMQMYSVRDPAHFEKPLPEASANGAPLDGIDGTGSLPFTCAPDRRGERLRFGVAWSCYDDVAGGIIARAHGLNSDLLGVQVDNTEIYRIMYATLFGRVLPSLH